ncbi:MAG: pectinesterase family protein [Balneolaceae bacterium]|nr:pectinesterase family protein [Balneolaceae bacterium]
MSKRLISVLLLCFGIFVTEAIAQDYETEFLVAQDGSGDFTSIQAAIDASKSFPYERITIHIKNGVYREKVKVHSWNTKLTLMGESEDSTIITV